MFVSQVTFSITKTTPLKMITHDPADEYANVKPYASCTVTFGPEECDPATAKGRKLMDTAYQHAEEAVLTQLVQFHEHFAALFKN